MSSRDRLGGIIHSYQKYNPTEFPSPTAPPPDMVSPAFEHLLHYGSMRRLTEEELANAVRIDPSQIQGLGPSLEALMEMLRQRKKKILETYETDQVQHKVERNFHDAAEQTKPPPKLQKQFQKAIKEEQIHDLERLWYMAGDERTPFARQLLQLSERLGEKYQIDELASKYDFTGQEAMTVEQALAIKQELETIDKLLKQLQEAAKNAQIGIIDLDELSQFAEPGDIEKLGELQRQVQEYLRQMAEQQGLEEAAKGGFQMTPRAYRLFQSKLLTKIFEQLQASRGSASRAHHRRRCRRTAADQGLRVRRFRLEHGYSLVVRQRLDPLRSWHPRSSETGRPRHSRNAQQSQMRLGRLARYVRLDAAQRAVRERQTDGPRTRWPHPNGISRRFLAIHRNVHLRQAAPHHGSGDPHAQAGDDL